MNSTDRITQSLSDQDNDDIDFLGLLDVLLDAKWLIVAVTLLGVFIAGTYALLTQPIYQANTLIQVEQNDSGANSALGEMAALFDAKSPSSAEMEILRSRLVVGQAVDELQLYVTASPDYLPFIGTWLAKRANSLSNPGIFGFGGYVSGTESIKLKQLDVPQKLEGKKLILKATDTGYELQDADGNSLVQGTVGSPADFEVNGASGRIEVSELTGKPGAQFKLMRTSRLRQVAGLQSQLNISEKGKQSGMIEATLEGTNPARTTRILNAVGTAYVRQNIERKAAEAEKTLTFLDAFLPELRKQMESSEDKYTKFRDKHGTFDLGAEGQASLSSSVSLQVKLLELQQKRRELAPQFTAAHPTIKVIDQQIAAINKELDGLAKNVQKMPDLEQQLLSLMRNVKVNSEMYVNLLNSGQQLRLVKEGKVGNVRVVDTAVVPENPIKPKRPLILAAGLMLGLILGIAIAFLRNMLRPGIKDPSEIESKLGMHVFATIPHSVPQAQLHMAVSNRAAGNHVLAQSAPQDPAVESLRSLRTALQFAMLNADNNIVLFTGPSPSIGKSFASVNFAAVLGAANRRVLLIDADLRKGYINQYFGMERRNGFSELISGNKLLEQVLHKDVMPNVDVITTGVLPPNPAELLLSSSAVQTIKDLSAQYDLILLDTTPVLAVSDALALAPHAGTVFLLARAQITTLGELEESSKRLRQAGSQVKGVIFNDLIATNRRYGSKYSSYRYTNYEYEA
ncbi:polysaccharide biosynthesis tyrosine autokinase [Alcaligenaceae bacterium]|nr:polysaccharide biosynthesis tyrosine autokinase [Alcaligenaceae bacterium]